MVCRTQTHSEDKESRATAHHTSQHHNRVVNPSLLTPKRDGPLRGVRHPLGPQQARSPHERLVRCPRSHPEIASFEGSGREWKGAEDQLVVVTAFWTPELSAQGRRG